MEILTNPILTKSNKGGNGREEKQNKRTVWRSKQTAQPHMAGMHNTCNSRNPVCHIEAHDSLTTDDQRGLDFNLSVGLRTFAPKSSHAQIFLKLAMQKGNDIRLPKR